MHQLQHIQERKRVCVCCDVVQCDKWSLNTTLGDELEGRGPTSDSNDTVLFFEASALSTFTTKIDFSRIHLLLLVCGCVRQQQVWCVWTMGTTEEERIQVSLLSIRKGSTEQAK